jgi:hypothetical protein
MMYSTKTASRSCRNPLSVVTLASLLVTAMLGCGKPSYQLETARVTGKVTIDGRPMPAGYVTFVTSRGRASSGTIQPDGTFEMSTYEPGDGAQVGTHPVIITPVPPDVGRQSIPVPERYTRAGTSGFTVEVKPDEDNYLELPLTTNKQKK